MGLLSGSALFRVAWWSLLGHPLVLYARRNAGWRSLPRDPSILRGWKRPEGASGPQLMAAGVTEGSRIYEAPNAARKFFSIKKGNGEEGADGGLWVPTAWFLKIMEAHLRGWPALVPFAVCGERGVLKATANVTREGRVCFGARGLQERLTEGSRGVEEAVALMADAITSTDYWCVHEVAASPPGMPGALDRLLGCMEGNPPGKLGTVFAAGLCRNLSPLFVKIGVGSWTRGRFTPELELVHVDSPEEGAERPLPRQVTSLVADRRNREDRMLENLRIVSAYLRSARARSRPLEWQCHIHRENVWMAGRLPARLKMCQCRAHAATCVLAAQIQGANYSVPLATVCSLCHQVQVVGASGPTVWLDNAAGEITSACEASYGASGDETMGVVVNFQTGLRGDVGEFERGDAARFFRLVKSLPNELGLDYAAGVARLFRGAIVSVLEWGGVGRWSPGSAVELASRSKKRFPLCLVCRGAHLGGAGEGERRHFNARCRCDAVMQTVLQGQDCLWGATGLRSFSGVRKGKEESVGTKCGCRVRPDTMNIWLHRCGLLVRSCGCVVTDPDVPRREDEMVNGNLPEEIGDVPQGISLLPPSGALAEWIEECRPEAIGLPALGGFVARRQAYYNNKAEQEDDEEEQRDDEEDWEGDEEGGDDGRG